MKQSIKNRFSIPFHVISNTFKIIADVENKRTEFKELNIVEAILASLIYRVVSIFSVIAVAISQNIISIFLIVLTFFIVIGAYNHYIIKSNKENNVLKPTIKIYLRNITFIIVFFLGYLLTLYSLVFPFVKMLQIYNPLITTFNKSTLQAPLFLLALTFIVPIMEEFIFRGVILGGLLKRYSSKTAILMSSILFGLSHLNIFQFIISFWLGLLVGYVYIRTRSICLCMLIHVLNDTLSFVPNYYCPEYAQLIGSNIVNIILFTVIGSIIIFVGFKGLKSN